MALFLKIVAFLCTLGVLLLFRSGALALLKQPAEGGLAEKPGQAASPETCGRMTAEQLLDFNAPKGSQLFPFRKDVQEALTAEIKRTSEAVKENLENSSTTKVAKWAVVIEALPEVEVAKIIAEWRAAEKYEISDLIVVKEATGKAEEFAKHGCGTSVMPRCKISEFNEVGWEAYDAVVLGAPLETLPKQFPEKFPSATRAAKPVSASAKNHAKWVARKFGISTEELEMIGNLFVDRKSAAKIFELRRLLRRWLEHYEFSKYEKAEALDDDYWPWPRRVQIANMMIGNLLRSLNFS